MKRFLMMILLLLLAVGTAGTPPFTYAQDAGVTLTVDAGFGTYFRDGDWFPVIVQMRNDGDDLTGQLLIRPETTNGVLNTTRTPVALPQGARQTAILYVTARAFTNQVRVELLVEDRVVAQQSTPIRAVGRYDLLMAVVTESAVGSMDLTGAQSDNAILQADLQMNTFPDRLAALDALDVIAFSDVDTGALTPSQVRALTGWVASGGHLILTGGANGQATAAGLGDILPMTPTASDTTPDLNALATWLRLPPILSEQTVISTGTLHPDARVLVSAGDQPLLVRRSLGDGVVDYLAVDPNSAPLRRWNEIGGLWTALITTVEPLPGWGNGVIDWEQAAISAEILPGFDPLPDVVPLFGFLALYILLIGPLNYVILARLNRREWAWITIPALILLFSGLAYTLGANLRGNEVKLNRLAVVRSWSDSDSARLDAIYGLLSPRRAEYTFAVDETVLADATFRPLPRPAVVGSRLIGNEAQSSIVVEETGTFQAVGFSVDASFVAGFNAAGTIPAPAIRGSATFADDLDGTQIVRGSVRNETDLRLTEPVILARRGVMMLDDIAPGDLVDFEITLPLDGTPSAARRSANGVGSAFFSNRFSGGSFKQSAIDILGVDAFDQYRFNRRLLSLGDVAGQEQLRRQALLGAVIEDYFDATGRGDRVYLAAWGDRLPVETVLTGSEWSASDRVLYLIELSSTVTPGTGEVVIAPHRFTWSLVANNTLSDVAPLNLTLQPGETAAFRFVPLPDAVLKQVNSIFVTVDTVMTGVIDFPIEIWNWEAQAWDEVLLNGQSIALPDPVPYLGPQNTVLVRVSAQETDGFMRFNRVNVSMSGRF